MKEEIDDFSAMDSYTVKLTKKYIIDLLDTLIFSKTILWDGVDQFNEMPIFRSSLEEGQHIEQRGALFVNKKTCRALRVLVTAQETVTQKVCYRITGLNKSLRVDDGKRLFYPFEAVSIDLSLADLNLGMRDTSAYSFADNTHKNKDVTLSRLFSVLGHLINSRLIIIEKEELFSDLLESVESLPPMPDDPHFRLVFGVKEQSSI